MQLYTVIQNLALVCAFVAVTAAWIDLNRRITELGRLTAMTAQDTVNTIVAQLAKAKDEIVAKIDELAAANPDVDFSALTEVAQALDDIVPDSQPQE